MDETLRPHTLFDPELVPFSGLSVWQPDWMHTKLLGTDSTLLGSCILFLIQKVMPGTPEENLATLWESVQTFYRTHKTRNRISRLTMKMVKHEPFPRLAAKAMETRDLTPAVEEFLRAWVGNPQCAWFHRLVLLSMRLDGLVFANKSYFLSEDERESLRVGIFEYSQTLTRLAHYFHRRGEAFVNFTLKNHYLLHLGLNASKTGISPRLAFCFQGEDFMSVVKHLCVGSSRGVDSAKLVDKVVAKYLRGLDLFLGQEAL